MAYDAETVENLRYEIEHIHFVSGRQITVELTGRILKDSIIRLSTGRIPLKTPNDRPSPEVYVNVKLVDTPNGLTPNELEAITVAWMRNATGLGMEAWDETPGGGALQWLCKQLPATSRTETTATWRVDDVLKQLIQKLTEKAAEFREPSKSWSSYRALMDHAYELRANYERGGIRGELVSVFEENAVASLWHGMRRLCVRQMPADPSDRLQTMADVRRAVDEVVRCLDREIASAELPPPPPKKLKRRGRPPQSHPHDERILAAWNSRQAGVTKIDLAQSLQLSIDLVEKAIERDRNRRRRAVRKKRVKGTN